MYSLNFEDKATQTGEDLYASPLKCQLSSPQEKLPKKSNKKNKKKKKNSEKKLHETIYNHLKKLRAKYRKDLESIYDCVEEMLNIVASSSGDFREGFKKALLERYVQMKAQDRESLMLLQFLEEYYEGSLLLPQSYTREMLEEDFEYALSLALQVTDQPSFFAQIYQIDAKK